MSDTSSDRLKAEMREAVLAVLATGARTSLTARDLKRLGIEIAVPVFTPERIARIREKLGASQDVFARLLGISKYTVSQWECGTKHPGGAAAVLLATIEHDPESIRFRFGEVVEALQRRDKSPEPKPVTRTARTGKVSA